MRPVDCGTADGTVMRLADHDALPAIRRICSAWLRPINKIFCERGVRHIKDERKRNSIGNPRVYVVRGPALCSDGIMRCSHIADHARLVLDILTPQILSPPCPTFRHCLSRFDRDEAGLKSASHQGTTNVYRLGNKSRKRIRGTSKTVSFVQFSFAAQNVPEE